MRSLYDRADREALLSRIATLQPGATRLWGKMASAQMLAHLVIAMDDASGGRTFKQSLLGKLVTPLIRSSIFGEKPFGKNSPTHPTYVVSAACDFEAERTRLIGLIERLGGGGAAATEGRVHPFFGELTGEQWGVLTHKHIDHHLRQFGL
jgi:hypothetical protein